MADIEITHTYSGNIDRAPDDSDYRYGRETGFPSPARDHYERPLSLDEHLIRRPAATYFVRVKGNELTDIGIHSEDLLIIDRSITPTGGHLVVVRLDGEHTIRRLERTGSNFYLIAGNSTEPQKITDDLDYAIWGVISHAIHKYI